MGTANSPSPTVSPATGPAIAGGVVQVLSAPLALIAQALAYLSAALLLSRIPTNDTRATSSLDSPSATPLIDALDPSPSPQPAVPPPANQPTAAGGFAGLVHHQSLRVLVACEVGYLFAFNLASVALVIFYVRILHLTPIQVGLVFATGSIGGIVAALVTPALRTRVGDHPSLVVGGRCGLAVWR